MAAFFVLTRLTQTHSPLTNFGLQLIPAGQNYSWQDKALAAQAAPELDDSAFLGFNFLAKVPA
jgi:hypothetical protein